MAVQFQSLFSSQCWPSLCNPPPYRCWIMDICLTTTWPESNFRGMCYKWAWAEVINHQTNLYHVLRQSTAQSLNGQWRILHKVLEIARASTLKHSHIRSSNGLHSTSINPGPLWVLLCSKSTEKSLKNTTKEFANKLQKGLHKQQCCPSYRGRLHPMFSSISPGWIFPVSLVRKALVF